MTASPTAGVLARLRAVRLRLLDDWTKVLRHAWSVHLTLLAAVLSAAEAGLAVLTGSPPIDPTAFAAIVGAVSLAAGLARLVAQSKLSGEAE